MSAWGALIVPWYLIRPMGLIKVPKDFSIYFRIENVKISVEMSFPVALTRFTEEKTHILTVKTASRAELDVNKVHV